LLNINNLFIMKSIIKKRIGFLYKQHNVRKYEITHLGLVRFSSLKPRSQVLLIDMLSLIKTSLDIEQIVFKINWKDLGFNSRQNFYLYRDELIKEHMLFCKNGDYFVNPCFINYLNRRQRTYFFNLFKLKQIEKTVKMNPPLFKVV
jgi:hypothetical protein